MFVASALALLALFGSVEPLLLKTQPDGLQTQPPLLAQQPGPYYHANEQQTVDNDAGLKGQPRPELKGYSRPELQIFPKPEPQAFSRPEVQDLLRPELQGVKADRQNPELLQQQQQQLPYLTQSANPTLAYVIIKPIQQQWFHENLGYDQRQPLYPPQEQLPYTPYRENNHDSSVKAPAKGQPAPPPPPPPPQPEPYPDQEPHDYLEEIHSKKQSKFSKLKQHIDRIFQKFASHSSYELDDNPHPPPPPPPRPSSDPEAQYPVQDQDQEPAQLPVQAQPAQKEEKGQTKQQAIEEPKETKEIKEHRESEPKKEPARVVSALHADDGFSKRYNIN